MKITKKPLLTRGFLILMNIVVAIYQVGQQPAHLYCINKSQAVNIIYVLAW